MEITPLVTEIRHLRKTSGRVRCNASRHRHCDLGPRGLLGNRRLSADSDAGSVDHAYPG
jgi:hypothetical protein